MNTTKAEVRSGAYYDSIVLMQLQLFLENLSGITHAGVMMGTSTNKSILEQNGLLTENAEKAQGDDLIIVIKGESEALDSALQQVDEFLQRKSTVEEGEYLPKSIESATSMLPESNWVSISVAGRYAGNLAKEALEHNHNVFLYSDNVSLDEEVALKKQGLEKGLLVMGPDCGTAIINGVGLGFANSVRKGNIGIIAASGTGMQAVASRIHQMGCGITHAIGTGGHDITERVGAITTLQALTLLQRDEKTQVIVMISKPPAMQAAKKVIQLARCTGKPVIVAFLGYRAEVKKIENLHFVSSMEECAKEAVKLSQEPSKKPTALTVKGFNSNQKYLRGLFSGGTLAYEALLSLRNLIDIYANISLEHVRRLSSNESRQHTILDLGTDEMTVGRLHPMIDLKMRIERLQQEAEDPGTAVILLDVVLGYGAHENPAGELAPIIQNILKKAKESQHRLEIVIMLVGTEEDPQVFSLQRKILEEAGAKVYQDIQRAMWYVRNLVVALEFREYFVDRAIIQKPTKVINVGLKSFYESLKKQRASTVQVDWKPPAGGNEELMSILQRLK